MVIINFLQHAVLTSQLEEFERKGADISAIYRQVYSTLTLNKHSTVWIALCESYDDDIMVS